MGLVGSDSGGRTREGEMRLGRGRGVKCYSDAVVEGMGSLFKRKN